MSTVRRIPRQQRRVVSQTTPVKKPDLPAISDTADADSAVYVRFITPAIAISHTSLESIDSETPPVKFPAGTKISELQEHIRPRCLEEMSGCDGAGSVPFVVDLHIAALRLGLAGATLKMYDLLGTESSPLNVFVVRRYENIPGRGAVDLAEYGGLSATAAWYPVHNATEASLSTFCSLLYVMRAKVKDETVRRRFLTALWETTHFPPAVRAMAGLFDGGGSALEDADKATLTQTFFALAKGFVPGRFTGGGKLEKIMEGSRQVLGWLLDQVMARKRGGSGSVSEGTWVRNASVGAPGSDADPGSGDGSELVSLTLPDDSKTVQLRVKILEEARGQPTHKQLALVCAQNGQVLHGGKIAYLVFLRRFRCDAHRIVPRPDEDRFFEQVINTNSIPTLSVVPPLSLTRSERPCLTLNEKGLISVWDLGKAGGEWARYWNPVSGIEVIPQNDHGQGMARKLRPVSVQRRKEGTWTLDGWDIGGINNVSSVDIRRPSEAVVTCIDVSSSMDLLSGLKLDRSATIDDTETRLKRAQELFVLFAETVNNLDLVVYFGGFSFNSTVKVFTQTAKDMTRIIGLFQEDVKALSASGGTAMWDALSHAGEMLLKFKNSQTDKNVDYKLRIIALTDGTDEHSKLKPEDVLRELWGAHIVVDSVVIGDTSGTGWSAASDLLFRFSEATGGYGIMPKTVEDLKEVGQMETLVNIKLRPPLKRPDLLPSWDLIPRKPNYDFSKPPALRPHNNQNDVFVDLSDAYSTYSSQQGQTGTTTAVTTKRRLIEEMKKIIDGEVLVSESNCFFWKVIAEGPPGKMYGEGTFVFTLDMGGEWPSRPPKLRFLTPILHPNITKVHTEQ
ncbi:hypothetical protein ABW19_dt0209844 [Dactylella cylindrospora]|nr:hypothetical protein ABW19_dt0209844 [Dactylella cylindrospora]